MSDLKIFLAVQGVQSDKAAGQTRQGDFRLGQTGVLIYHLQTGGGWQGVGWALGAGWSEILSLSLSLSLSLIT